MNKIPTIFLRDFSDKPGYSGLYVTRDINPFAEWVFDGEGIATQKYDGTCVMYDGERWLARREVKAGKPAPIDFIPINIDDVTGKTIGWERIESSPFAKFHAEALAYHSGRDPLTWAAGTYELVGPRINGNPERVEQHELWLHSAARQLSHAPRDFDGLARYLADFPGEGIVWHHPDGRMAKLKRKDFPA